ncbi:S-layer homology domain-containing protein [Cohnella sp. 56]|uniref:S-layer homology domain-containing protein n=1 Tax=Cohnella sp. 56 TaxID=3113722 RepID=UPI0030E7B309
MRKNQLYRLFILVMVLTLGWSLANPGPAAHAGVANYDWQNVSDQSMTSDLRGLVYAEDKSLFVAVGAEGAILTSSDGMSWAKQIVDTQERLNAVAYGDGYLIAVGENGVAAYSQDGSNWAVGTIGPDATNDDSYSLNGIAYGDGQFVVVGAANNEEGNGLIYSLDAQELKAKLPADDTAWADCTMDNTLPIYNVKFNEGYFQAVGMMTSFYSLDGLNWDVDFLGVDNFYDAIHLSDTNQSLYLSTTSDDTEADETAHAVQLISHDTFSGDVQAVSTGLYSLAYGNGTYIAVGENGRYSRFHLAQDEDGQYVFVEPEMTQRKEPGVDSTLRSVVFGGGRFVAVGDGGTILAYKSEELRGLSLTAGAAGGTTKLDSLPEGSFKYAIGEAGSRVRPTYGDSSQGYMPLTAGLDLSVTAGQHLYIVQVDKNGLVVGWADLTIQEDDIQPAGTEQPVPATGLNVTASDPSGAANDGKTKLTVSEQVSEGYTLVYKNFGSGDVQVPNVGEKLTGSSELPESGLVPAANGDKIGVAEVDADGNAKRFGQTTAVVVAEPSEPVGIYNQDGIGYSGTISPNPIGPVVSMTGYNNWPSDLNRGSIAFAGGVFDGQSIWMIPYSADSVVKIDKDSGAMTGYKNWPAGITKTQGVAFSSGVFDGQSIWMIPYAASSVVKIDKDTGEMTGYSGWPEGVSTAGTAFVGGVYDGRYIWMIPYAVDRVVRLDTRTGTMTGYSNWPLDFNKSGSTFTGGVFDGRNIWMIPSGADRVIKLDTVTGAMTGYSNWPDGFAKESPLFAGGIFDGLNLWMIPTNADQIVKLNTVTGEMTGYSNWPQGFSKHGKYFYGGAFDGRNIWMVPFNPPSDRVIRFDTITGDMTGYTNFPDGFSKGLTPFRGGVFDGENVWMIPYAADRVVKLGNPVFKLTYTAGANGSIEGSAAQSVKIGQSGTAVTAKANSGYHFAGWSDGGTEATRTDSNILVDLNVTATFEADEPPAPVPATGLNVTASDPSGAANDGKTKLTVSEKVSEGYKLVYRNFGSGNVEVPNVGEKLTGYSELPESGLVAAANGDKIAVAEVDADGKAQRFGQTTAVVVAEPPAPPVPATGLNVTASDPSGATNDGKTKLTVAEKVSDGYKLVYRNFGGGNVEVPNVGEKLTGYSELPESGLVTAANGDKIAVAEVDADGKATRFGQTTAVVVAEPPAPVPDSPVTSTPSGDDVEVLVNGKAESAGRATTTMIGGVKTTVVAVDPAKLLAKLEAAGNHTVVTIPVKSDANVIIGELDGRMVKNMEDKAAVIEIKTDNATYTLPAGQINIDAISRQLGVAVKLEDIKVRITIAKASAAATQLLDNAAAAGGFKIAVPPLDFTVTGVYGDKTIDVSNFNAYVERTVALPDGIDPGKITTGIVIDSDGTVRHVPTKIVEESGKYYAKINSLTNSTYAVVWHPLIFADMNTHWAKDIVNDMGSRLIVQGVNETTFNPNADMTRAEFAAIVVRGLGLKPGEGTSSYSDVAPDAWYASAVSTASAYGLVSGFADGTYRPSDKITREQAMTIVAKAMKLTGLSEKTGAADTSLVSSFTDGASAGGWAKDAIAAAVKAGLVTGREGGRLLPKANVSRAEVAALIQRLLQKSDLI